MKTPSPPPLEWDRVTKDELDIRLESLENRLIAEMYKLASKTLLTLVVVATMCSVFVAASLTFMAAVGGS